MESRHGQRAGVVRLVNEGVIEQEVIPDTFPTWASFFRTVAIGLSITLAQFAILILLVAKHGN